MIQTGPSAYGATILLNETCHVVHSLQPDSGTSSKDEKVRQRYNKLTSFVISHSANPALR